MAPTHQFHRGKAYGNEARDVAELATKAPFIAPTQIAGSNQTRHEQRRESKMGEDDVFGASRLRNACLQGVETWAGRPVSRWCRYGYWDEAGDELTVTRIDVKRARFL